MEFKYRRPTKDARVESCHVAEETLRITGKLRASERSSFLHPFVSGSGKELEAAGRSIGIIKPKNTKFYFKKKSADRLAEQRLAYAHAARQQSLLDEDLKAFEPSPYEFRFTFDDESGSHDYENADWEAHAMFFNGMLRDGNEQSVLKLMDEKFNVEYPARGMLFAIGNLAKRQKTWQLLGVLRVDETSQGSLF